MKNALVNCLLLLTHSILHPLRKSEIRHKQLNTDAIALLRTVSVFDWLFLGFEFSRASNDQSETSKGPLERCHQCGIQEVAQALKSSLGRLQC